VGQCRAEQSAASTGSAGVQRKSLRHPPLAGACSSPFKTRCDRVGSGSSTPPGGVAYSALRRFPACSRSHGCTLPVRQSSVNQVQKKLCCIAPNLVDIRPPTHGGSLVGKLWITAIIKLVLMSIVPRATACLPSRNYSRCRTALMYWMAFSNGCCDVSAFCETAIRPSVCLEVWALQYKLNRFANTSSSSRTRAWTH
jgi:hypothetical protein